RPDHERHRRTAPGGGALQEWLVQGDRHAHAVRPARPRRPPPERHVAHVAYDQETAHRVHPEPQRHADQRQARRHRQPTRPHEAVAQRPQRAAQRAAQPLDLVGGRALVLRPRRRPHGEPTEVGVRVEEMGATCHGRPVHRPVPGRPQIAQQRLLRHAHADPLQALVVPGALHREQPQQAAAERRTPCPGHRSHTSTAPPARPAANHLRLAPRPTTRSVPAVAVAIAPATAAPPSSVTPRSGSAPAKYTRTTCASASPAAVTTAARSASRAIAVTCNRTSNRTSPASSRPATAGPATIGRAIIICGTLTRSSPTSVPHTSRKSCSSRVTRTPRAAPPARSARPGP